MSLKLLLVLAFIVLILIGGINQQIPLTLLYIYLAASAVTFLVYAWDKSVARKGHWRVKERHLHLLAFACGWPGALVAQSILRHKSQKRPFRLVLALVVITNLILLGLLLSLPA
ncbi:DUF1294 domain-containing protein [Shewanella waksmanii]|uniref:DUF1294 domain-containing protein n=1 Tax=Shewanella waksmanii TaxID=213783 RepID=UPI00373597A5